MGVRVGYKLYQIGPKWDNCGTFKDQFQYILILKSPIFKFVPFGANLIHYGAKSAISESQGKIPSRYFLHNISSYKFPFLASFHTGLSVRALLWPVCQLVRQIRAKMICQLSLESVKTLFHLMTIWSHFIPIRQGCVPRQHQ